MKIQVDFLPEIEMRYTKLGAHTVGDYYRKDGVLHFEVLDQGNNLSNMLVLIHEMIEQTLTEAKGIPEEEITKHDLMFEELVKNKLVEPDSEPGEHPDSPYWKEHMLAETVERLMLIHLKKDFKSYNANLF